VTYDIDTKKAGFDEIDKFVRNLLHADKAHRPEDYEAHLAYYTAMTHALLGRKASQSADKLAYEIDQARSAVGKGLDKLTVSIADASNAADVTARDALSQSRRMVWATWGLVVVTGCLGIATAFLVFYTRQLVFLEPR
jgi:hypothetical protein